MNHCTSCDAPLAHDQRYCLDCGARRGALPDLVAAMIAGIEGQARSEAVAPTEPALTGAPRRQPLGGWLPSPRAAALAVMGMLAFGAEIGAVVGATGVTALASTPLVLVRHALAPPPAAPSAGDQGGGGSSGGVTTVTVAASSPAPPSGGGGSTAAAPSQALAPASAPATTTTTTSTTSPPANPYGLPPIQHVFVIMLGDQPYSQTFESKDPFLSQALPKQGKLIPFYYAVAGGELANQIALISGQGPTQQTTADCPKFTNLSPATSAKRGQVVGSGCVYPRSTDTLPGELTAAHLTWKAYIQGMANGVSGQPQTCRHPALGATDSSSAPEPGDPYVTWRDPFVYFHSVIDPSTCAHDVVDLSQLSTDLVNTATTPSLSYIVPNLCDDGTEQPCAPGATGGVAAADSFLRTAVPEIKNSAAYQAGGVIMITFDQAPQSGPDADSSSCCSTPRYPNVGATPTAPTTTIGTDSSTTPTASTTTTTPTPVRPPTPTPTPTPTSTSQTSTSPTTTSVSPAPNLGGGQGQTSPTGGGGQVGLLLISPWVKAGTTDPVDYYNHFSLLASLEDIFNLKHLGYAGASGLPALDAGTFDGKGPAG